MKTHFARMVTPLAGLSSVAYGIALDLSSQDSIKSVASTLAYDMMTYYSGNQSGQVPGLLPGPCAAVQCYYWWEAGAMFGSLINYWQYTGDTSYNPTVSQALQFQVGPDQNFNPPNQSKNMGVDDQVFWAFSAMDAAEANFPNPASDQPSWLSLAQAVFNFQSGLWDTAICGGGFRWQVYSFNAGYNLKNTVANGGNFQLAARLARYTGNQTYADWADMVWDWIFQSELISYQGDIIIVHDNTDADYNCTSNAGYYWTYNYGTLLVGAAYMYNYTEGNSTWGARIQSLLNSAYAVLYPQQYGGGNIVVEVCEPSLGCNNDQSSFKAYWSRWLAVTAQLAPFTYNQIMPKLAQNAAGAAGQCVGGANGRMCGREWYTTTWDGSSGVGQQVRPSFSTRLKR
jgi:mannan endo-1,6-alpha-mannosidase